MNQGSLLLDWHPVDPNFSSSQAPAGANWKKYGWCDLKSSEKTSWGNGSWNPIIYQGFIHPWWFLDVFHQQYQTSADILWNQVGLASNISALGAIGGMVMTMTMNFTSDKWSNKTFGSDKPTQNGEQMRFCWRDEETWWGDFSWLSFLCYFIFGARWLRCTEVSVRSKKCCCFSSKRAKYILGAKANRHAIQVKSKNLPVHVINSSSNQNWWIQNFFTLTGERKHTKNWIQLHTESPWLGFDLKFRKAKEPKVYIPSPKAFLHHLG